MNDNEKLYEKYLYVNKNYKFWINTFYFVVTIFIVIILSFEGSQYIPEIQKILRNDEFLNFMDSVIPNEQRIKNNSLQIHNRNVLIKDIIYEFLKPNFEEEFYLQYDFYPRDFIFKDNYKKSCFSSPDRFLDSIKGKFNISDSLISKYKENREQLIIINVDTFRILYINEVGIGKKNKDVANKYKTQFSNYLNNILLLDLYRNLLAPKIIKQFNNFKLEDSEWNKSWNEFAETNETKKKAITPLINTPFKFPYLDLPVRLKIILFFIVPYLFFSSIYISVLKRYYNFLELNLKELGYKNSILPTLNEKLIFLNFHEKTVVKISSFTSFAIVDLLPKLITVFVIFIIALNQCWIWAVLIMYLLFILWLILKFKYNVPFLAKSSKKKIKK